MVPQLMSYKILAYGLSDIGLVRQNNEDAWTQVPDDQFFALADGMGGHQAGEIASKEAVENLCVIFKKKYVEGKTLLQTKQIIAESIKEVNQLIYKMSHRDDKLSGMGTTLCCVFLHPLGLVYGHVGDSRIYRFRHQRLKQLTQDHSLLRDLIDLGQLNEREAQGFQHKNIITKAIGTEPNVEPSVKTDSVMPDDIILMCSDGLTDMLSHDEIERIIKHSPVQDITTNLVEASKHKGGLDNITVVMMKIQDKNDTADLS